jgi:hypothetical protein
VKDGVKVGDILDARAALLRTSRKFLFKPLRVMNVWRTEFSENHAEITLRVAEELDAPACDGEQVVYRPSRTRAATVGSEGDRSVYSVGLGHPRITVRDERCSNVDLQAFENWIE